VGAVVFVALPLPAQIKSTEASRTGPQGLAEVGTPDPDANKVNVNVTAESINVPNSIRSGKTAFVVKNTTSDKQNVEVHGRELDDKFVLILEPNETKVLQVDLRPGKYNATYTLTNGTKKNVEVNLTVH